MKRNLGIVGRLVEYAAPVPADGGPAQGAAPRERGKPTLLVQLAVLLGSEGATADAPGATGESRGSRERADVLRLRPCPEAPG